MYLLKKQYYLVALPLEAKGYIKGSEDILVRKWAFKCPLLVDPLITTETPNDYYAPPQKRTDFMYAVFERRYLFNKIFLSETMLDMDRLISMIDSKEVKLITVIPAAFGE